MSSYGELIQALRVLKNVKEKRHGIKTLASLCANRAFQVRIVQRGGWRTAILPLIISLDEDCRMYAALAIANLSTAAAAHAQLLEEEVLRHLVPILQSEEVQEVIAYVLNALGNFACSNSMWYQLQNMNTVDGVVALLRTTQREEIRINCLFCLANLTADPWHRKWMMAKDVHELVWGYMQDPNFTIMSYALAILRGLAVETKAQEMFPSMGLVPLLIGIFYSQCPQHLKTLCMDMFLHFSMLKKNGTLMMEKEVVQVIEAAGRGTQHVEYVPLGIAIIANMCESVDLHDRIVESPLFEVLTEHIHNDNTTIQSHVVRALMQLSLSPKYHHVILSTGALANVCPVAMTDRLSIEMRTNALQMMGSVCATHPTTPTPSDIIDLMFLICNQQEHIDIRRAAALVIANSSADHGNMINLLHKPYMEALSIAAAKSDDCVLVDYLMQFFHNVCKLEAKAGGMLMTCGFQRHMFNYERLESLSITSAIYLCDTCRQLAGDAVVRATLMEEMLFSILADAWVVYIEDPRIAPHLALMCSAFCYHSDAHQEFVLQGGVRLVIQLYSKSKVEHVRLCSLLTLLYLSENGNSQRCIAQEKGIQVLLTACENETHIDLITNSLKALIPFATSDDFRPQLGMEGGLDTFSSFLFSDQLQLQQLGVYLLQNLLEFRENRRIFLGIAEERKCEEDYLDTLIRFLPRVITGQPSRIARMKKNTTKKAKDADEATLAPHDPFICRSCIHSVALLSLEHDIASFQRLINLGLPKILFDLFYSEQIDKSSGEAIVLVFANLLHSSKQIQGQVMKGADIVTLMLAPRDMLFAPHTIARCLSALLCIARVPDFKKMVIVQLDLLMADINANLNSEKRDENFYQIAALHCALLSELARSSYEYHERMARAGMVEALLVFITVAGKGYNGEVCIELIMGAVFGIAALVGSPTSGELCMANLIFPATRMQLLLSLLRLPQDDINRAFHTGTVGIRTLQRVTYPDITAEELHVDHMDPLQFLGSCSVKPADFIYRNVIRTMCLLLAHPEMGPRVQTAISPSNVVPTCHFAMKGCDDVYVQVYGFLLVANFSRDRSLLHSFMTESAVMNELLTTIRRAGPEGNPEEEVLGMGDQLARAANGSGPWSSGAVQLNRYMLAMAALTNFAERVKEKLKGENGEITTDPDLIEEGGLSVSNRITLNKLTAACMKSLDCEAMEENTNQMSNIAEFTALLRVLVMANTFLGRVQQEDGGRGGEVKIERIDPAEAALVQRKVDKNKLVIAPLRYEFHTLGALNQKCDGMLKLCEMCLGINQAPALIAAVVECLTGLTFLSPLSLRTPVSAYQMTTFCPDWLHSSLFGLIANSLADPDRIGQFNSEQPESLANEESDHLFPLLATSTLEIRQRVLGVLANAATQEELMNFIQKSGVFRICKAIPSKGYFVEHFALMIEIARMLANLTCRKETHGVVMSPDTVAFLRDVLRHCAVLLHTTPAREEEEEDNLFDFYEVRFETTDLAPLGLRIRWNLPPMLNEVIPDTPAARVCEDLQPDDELVEVNGVDVTELEQDDIAPMFEARPLKLLFRRRQDRTLMLGKDDGVEMARVGNIQIERIEKTTAYGDSAQYLECFNLAVLTVHNLAVNINNLALIHSEPRILGVLLEVMPAEITSPAMRRLLFSALTCLSQEIAVSGRIFLAMAEYFQQCEKPDPSLPKYIMCCANLYYTSMTREEVQPDRGMLIFVSRISAREEAIAARRALIEILHGMAQAPKELRKKFISREILILAHKMMDCHDVFDIQSRAFESVFFLTLGGCNPDLWFDVDVLPGMVRAAGAYKNSAEEKDEALYHTRADALWEITLRTLDHCLQYPALVNNFKSADLDRFLMDFLVDDRKPVAQSKVVADFMANLLQSEIKRLLWMRWQGLGVGDRIVNWFRLHKVELTAVQPTRKASDTSVRPCDSLDSMLHMLLFAIQVDPAIIVALVAPEVMQCIANRILDLAASYEEWNQAFGGHRLGEAELAVEEVDDAPQALRKIDPATGQLVTYDEMLKHYGLKKSLKYLQAYWEEECEALHEELVETKRRPSAETVAKADTSFRTIAQLLTALVANEHGLSAMSGLNLELALVSLLELPDSAFRVPVLLVLCAMSSHKDTCTILMESDKFIGVLHRLESKLAPGEAPPMPDELEYLICILDRSCCHPELALIAQKKLFRLLSVLPSKAETLSAKLMGLRALSRCAFVNPACMDNFAQQGLACMHYLMAVNSCLNMGTVEMDSQKASERRRFIEDVQIELVKNPNEAELVTHFSRAILCEAVSVSRVACGSVFEHMDLLGMLQDLQASFDESQDRMALPDAKHDVVAADLMNKLVAMLHILLCCIFRHGKAQHTDLSGTDESGGLEEKEAKPIVNCLLRTLDTLSSLLRLTSQDMNPQDGPVDPTTKIVDMLTGDIRVLFYLSAVLREISAKPLRSPFLTVTRSQPFFQVLDACIKLAMRRLARETKGPPPKDLFMSKLRGGPGETPLSKHMEDFDLGLIFEHLVVALRHTLCQAMYVAPEVSTKPLPWSWVSLEELEMHRDIMTWLPQIVKRYHKVPAIRTETLRYFVCASSYDAAPFAKEATAKAAASAVLEGAVADEEDDEVLDVEPQSAELLSAGTQLQVFVPPGYLPGDIFRAKAGEEDYDITVPDSAAGGEQILVYLSDTVHIPKKELKVVKVKTKARQPFGGVVSLRQIELRQMLAEEMETSEDMCTLSLATIAVSNFASYEREILEKSDDRAKAEKDIPVEDLARLQKGVVRVLTMVPSFGDKEVATTTTMAALRLWINLLAMDVMELTAVVHSCDTLQAMLTLFDFWFKDQLLIKSAKSYMEMLQLFVLLLRNWSCSTCLAEARVAEKLKDRKNVTKELVELSKVLASGLDAQAVPTLINFIVKVVSKLTESSRNDVEQADINRMMDDIIIDVLTSVTTLLKRTDDHHSMDWKLIDLYLYEQLLIYIKERRFAKMAVFEDEFILNTLYMMVKQGFPFKGTYFLEYLMEVAYGDHRQEHTAMQDMAAICCSMISTQASKDHNAPTVNVAQVVKDNAAFIHALIKVPDPKMQIWHYRLITGWSRRPNVLDDITNDAVALKQIVDWLLSDNLCRYSAIVVHNISMMRSKPLLTHAEHLTTVCEVYRRLAPGSHLHRGDEAQRRQVRRLIMASLRNCIWNSSNLEEELGESILKSILDLVTIVEEADVPFYLAMLLTIVQGCDLQRIRRLLPAHMDLMQLLSRYILEEATACQTYNPGEKQPSFEMVLYGLATAEEQERAKEYNARVLEEEINANAPKRKAAAEAYRKLIKMGLDSPTKGLGKKPSLYTRSRKKRDDADAPGDPTASTAKATKGGANSGRNDFTYQKEFVYFAVIEILTHTTFLVKEEEFEKEAAESDPRRQAVQDALKEAFARSPIDKWLASVQVQTQDHKDRQIVLSDLYVHVTAKLLWHCWTHEIFRKYVETTGNMEVLSVLVPFLLSWPNEDVQTMASEVCLYAGMYRYPVVCDFLAKNYQSFPELACSLLTNAFTDVEGSGLQPKQAVAFINIFVNLLRERSLSHSGLLRLAVGLEHGLLLDNPKGICSILAQREFELLGNLLESLATYNETATVKTSMVVTLTKTVGKFYKALPELDEFVLRVLDLAVPLLEAEFTLFMPVLYRLASEGGRRVQGPMLGRQLHLRVARLLEQAVAGMESDATKIVGYNDEEENPSAGPLLGPKLGNRHRAQWCLAFLTALAGSLAKEAEEGESAQQIQLVHDIHFDSFICVDLLPILVRILRQAPSPFEALAVTFLMSTVATSPCLPPHMPDMLRISERAFPKMLKPQVDLHGDAGGKTEDGEGLSRPGDQAPAWEHLKVPSYERIVIGVRRCFIHLLANASHVPVGNPCVLYSDTAWTFLTSQGHDAFLFSDPAGGIHAKLHALAHLCVRPEDHHAMLGIGLLRILTAAKEEIDIEMFDRIEEPDFPDLRLPWVHIIMSLVVHSGARLITGSDSSEFRKLIAGGLEFAQDLQFGSQTKLRVSGGKGLALDLECQQAFAEALAPLSVKAPQFGEIRPTYTLYLLSLLCSAPVMSLRIASSRHLMEMMQNGYQPEFAGAAFLKTCCLESFKRIICGPNDDLAESCARMLMQMAGACYDVHVHLLGILNEVVGQLGNPQSSPTRVMALAELFVALTKEHTGEVLDAVVELSDITAFLGLSRSHQAARRELVQKWLECYGSSLYEIDEVAEVFKASTLKGILHMSARSTLDPPAAENLRRVMFGLVLRRVDVWRTTYFGPYEYVSESLLAALVPMCELQPDLVAGLVAFFHSFLTRGETKLLERIWSGDHLPWLCRRMAHKSRAQLAMMQTAYEASDDYKRKLAAGLKPEGGVSAMDMQKGWEGHADLVTTQGMAARLVWALYDLYPAELGIKVTKTECIVKNWQSHLKFYCDHVSWPLRESKELETATESVISLEMSIVWRLVTDVNPDLQRKLVQQGMVGVCSTVLLPTPDQQRSMYEAIGTPLGEEPSDTSEIQVLQDAKMLAGAVVTQLLALSDTYRYIQDRRALAHATGMFAQLHHWRRAVFDQQGSLSVLSTVTLLERVATLYMSLLSSLTVDWCFENLGLQRMDVFSPVFLEMWGLHPNIVLKHHALRLFSSYCQVHPLYASVMNTQSNAEQLAVAINRTFGQWDVRELRHLIRLLIASFCHALGISAMTDIFSQLAARELQRNPDCAQLAQVIREGAIARSNSNAARFLIRVSYIQQVLAWAEKPGDMYGRVWGLWMVVTVLASEIDAAHLKQAQATAQGGQLDPETVLLGQEETLEEAQSQRRSKLQAQLRLASGTNEDAVRGGHGNEAKSRTHWLRGSSSLCNQIAMSAGKCLSSQWKESKQLGGIAAAWCIVELPEFVQTAVETIDGNAVLKCFALPEKPLHLSALLLISCISSMRLPLNARNIAGPFLRKFHDLQQVVIEGIAGGGEGPFDMIARWLHYPAHGLPCAVDFRGLVCFMVGQCMCTPLATTPSLDLDSALAAPGRGLTSYVAPKGLDSLDEPTEASVLAWEQPKTAAPPVAECGKPPEALLDKLAQEIIKEDLVLRSQQVKGEGPVFSTLLCNLLYSLAVMVPHHPKAAAHSASVRGAAFAQLMKVQQIVSQSIQPKSLFDKADGDRAKLFLYIRAVACIRSALQIITGSWFAADFGARFVVSEEGGKDFMQYCTKHINQVYNNKTALTRILGSPWERVMLSQGPTTTIAELLIVVCSSDANLIMVSKLGGEQALHNLSRYGDGAQIRQQATMLLTKLAVMMKL